MESGLQLAQTLGLKIESYALEEKYFEEEGIEPHDLGATRQMGHLNAVATPSTRSSSGRKGFKGCIDRRSPEKKLRIWEAGTGALGSHQFLVLEKICFWKKNFDSTAAGKDSTRLIHRPSSTFESRTKWTGKMKSKY